MGEANFYYFTCLKQLRDEKKETCLKISYYNKS